MGTTKIWTNLWLTILMMGALGVATEADATRITLSGDSSEATIAPSLLDATLDFAVTDGNTLTLTVDNDTASFDIVAIYFNASSQVPALSLKTGPAKWKLASFDGSADSTTAGGFGSFDFAVAVPANKAGKDGFDAGDSAVFEFTVSGNGSFDASDLTAELSVTGKGDVAAFAAAKFVGKSGGAVGAAHAPEPSAALLLGLGLAGLSLLSRRGKV